MPMAKGGLELICDFKQAKYLAGWFRKRGYGLRVAGGEACEGRKGVRNSVAVFGNAGNVIAMV